MTQTPFTDVHAFMGLMDCFRFLLRSGYEAESRSFVAEELNLSVVGRSFMITGANSGIGKATAMAIAKKGKEAELWGRWRGCVS